ncbi:transposase [Streptomyces sp. NPDC091376]|uniref:transposase n=1 Tax=Streptomyces sp. NPDC091376 TaxID=3365994 RepID=UPI0038259FD8
MIEVPLHSRHPAKDTGQTAKSCWSTRRTTHGPTDPVSPGQSTGPFRLDHGIVGPGVTLTDVQRARIEPLVPDRTPERGGRWRDHRQVINAIAFKFQTGTQWTHGPAPM